MGATRTMTRSGKSDIPNLPLRQPSPSRRSLLTVSKGLCYGYAPREGRAARLECRLKDARRQLGDSRYANLFALEAGHRGPDPQYDPEKPDDRVEDPEVNEPQNDPEDEVESPHRDRLSCGPLHKLVGSAADEHNDAAEQAEKVRESRRNVRL